MHRRLDRARRNLVAVLAALPALGFLLVVAGPESGAQAAATSVVFDEVGATQWTVPADVACVTFEVTGAGGGEGGDFGEVGGSPGAEGTLVSVGGTGGLGGQVTADVVVTPGESLQINVGGPERTATTASPSR